MPGDRKDVPPSPTGSGQGIAPQFTYNELIDQLASELLSIEELRPDDVTIIRLMQRTGKKRSTVERFLKGEVDAGRLVMISAVDERGKRVNAYRRK